MGNEERDGRGAHILVEGNARDANTYSNYNYKVKKDETILFTNNNTKNNTETIDKTIQTIVNNSKQYKQ